MSPHPYDKLGPDANPEFQPPRILLFFMRVVVPVSITVIGIILIVMGHARYKSVFANRDSLYTATGLGFVLVALCIWMLNWMMKMNVDSGGDRDKEAAARAYFVEHGHWPKDS